MVAELQGIGMTSRRTRMRLIQRLRDAGITDQRVLDVMADVPRHIFLDEKPINTGQTDPGESK